MHNLTSVWRVQTDHRPACVDGILQGRPASSNARLLLPSASSPNMANQFSFPEDPSDFSSTFV